MNADRRYDRFVEQLRPVRKQLYHFARGLTNDYDEACDLVGATLLGALESYNPEHPPVTFRSYLFTIAIRIHRRKRYRARLFIPLKAEHVETERCRLTPPDESADVRTLYNALNNLPEKQREAVALFELTGLSLKEIREIQGGSLSGVKSRIVRGRTRLAELLGVSAEGSPEPTSPPSTSAEATTEAFHTTEIGDYR